MKKKLTAQKGFTLAELLIVVAIIGVLVAISIPIFGPRLEGSREATDAANLRSAYASGTAALLTGKYGQDSAELSEELDGSDGETGTAVLWYTKNGDLANAKTNAMRGKSSMNGYQGETITDFPDGIVFQCADNTDAVPSADEATAGNSGRGDLCVYIVKSADGSADSVSVFFVKHS